MENVGISGTFGGFAVISLLGGLYFLWKMKQTAGLTSGQAKQVFYPPEFTKDTDTVITNVEFSSDDEEDKPRELSGKYKNLQQVMSQDSDEVSTGFFS